jgi:hypothetical protein
MHFLSAGIRSPHHSKSSLIPGPELTQQLHEKAEQIEWNLRQITESGLFSTILSTGFRSSLYVREIKT